MAHPYFSQCTNILSMIGCINTHVMSGHALNFNTWKFMHTGQYHIRMEGVLISPIYVEHLTVHTCGTFVCSECKSCNNPLSIMGTMYTDNTTSLLLCNACVMNRNFTNVNVLHASFQIRDDFPMLINLAKETDMEYEDVRDKVDLDENLKAMKQKCELVADANNLIYLDGACVADLRRHLLSYRVAKRWQDLVKKRRTVKMFRILYHYMEDINASMVIAKEKCK